MNRALMSRGADANAMSWEEIEAAAKLQVISLCILMIGSYVFESVHAVQQRHHTHRVTAYVSLFVCCRCCHPLSITGRPKLLYLSLHTRIIVNNVVIDLLQAKDQGFVDKCTDDDDLWIERLYVHTFYMFSVHSPCCLILCAARWRFCFMFWNV